MKWIYIACNARLHFENNVKQQSLPKHSSYIDPKFQTSFPLTSWAFGGNRKCDPSIRVEHWKKYRRHWPRAIHNKTLFPLMPCVISSITWVIGSLSGWLKSLFVHLAFDWYCLNSHVARQNWVKSFTAKKSTVLIEKA